MEAFDPTRAMVFILHGNGAPEGAGFLVSRRHILTCCHVVEKVRQAGNLLVEFPLLDDRPRVQVIEKRRYPYIRGASSGNLHDIALLELTQGQSLPRGAEPVLLSRLSENEISDAPVEMYGFPDDLERDHWVKGTVRRRVRDARIQIDHKPGARTVVKGFSGGMVWSPENSDVLGLVTQIYEDRKEQRAIATYMIPAADLDRVIRENRSDAPPLLRYRIDRMDQVHAIRRMLPGPNEPGGTGPIICILHGDERQGHKEFWQCLADFYWRKYINGYSVAKANPKRYNISWPKGADDFEYIQQFLLRGLSNAIGIEESTDPIAVSEALNQRTSDTPVLIYILVNNHDMRGDGNAILDHFMNFWEDWPQRPASVPLLACLAVRYVRKDETKDHRKPFWKRLFYRRHDLEKLNDNIRKELRDRHGEKEVPELHGVTRAHVLDWLEEDDVVRYCQDRLDDPESIINAIYKDNAIENQNGRIPMADLAGALAERFFF